jgi:isopentenyl diphosphate isomerase/L-lactate dehydrogenase-like FMN-dependent dehydrogenase
MAGKVFNELKIAMYLTGASHVEELSQKKVCITGRTWE